MKAIANTHTCKYKWNTLNDLLTCIHSLHNHKSLEDSDHISSHQHQVYMGTVHYCHTVSVWSLLWVKQTLLVEICKTPIRKKDKQHTLCDLYQHLSFYLFRDLYRIEKLWWEFIQKQGFKNKNNKKEKVWVWVWGRRTRTREFPTIHILNDPQGLHCKWGTDL